MNAAKKKARPDWGTAKEALLDAAAQEFAEFGFRGASVSRIAKRAGVTQPLINHHFGSKDGLFRAVLDWVFSDMQGAVGAALDPELSSREQLLELARQIVFFFARRPELARIVNTETNHPSEAFDYLFSTYLEPIMKLTQTLMRKAKKEGEFRRDLDPRHMHFLVVGAAMQPFTEPEIARRAFGLEPFSDKFIERHANMLCGLLEAGMGGED